ncbi:MAG: translation initiation factor IF-3 [Nonlabens sp.]
MIKEDKHKINDKIRARQVRLVQPGEGEPKIMDTRDAMKIAQEKELDLVEISPNADPPVAKLLDYKKFVYEQNKREKAMKAKASKVIIKEIRFGPNTDEHDYEFKKKHAEKFLKEGAKLKAYVFFKGRSIIYKDQGEILLLNLAKDLEELGKVEQMPKMEGKRMNMFIAPKKK